MLAADERQAVRAQQLDGASRSEIERLVEATDVADIDSGTGDAAEAGTGKAAAEGEGRLPGRAADESLAHEQPEVGLRALRQVIRAVAEVAVRAGRCGAQVQLSRRIEEKQVAHLRYAAHVSAQQVRDRLPDLWRSARVRIEHHRLPQDEIG